VFFATLSEIGVEFAALAGIPAYLLLQAWTLRNLGRGPRYAALLPILIAFSVIAPCFDPTASRGGPSTTALLLFAPGAALYLIALAGCARCGERLEVLLAARRQARPAPASPEAEPDPGLALAA